MPMRLSLAALPLFSLLLVVVLAGCDSTELEAESALDPITGPNELRATVNGVSLVVPEVEIFWGQPDSGFNWSGLYCVPDDYPQNLYIGFEIPEVEVGTYSVSRDAPTDGPDISISDNEGDAGAGYYDVREGETATLTISGVDRETGYIQGQFSGTFDYIQGSGFEPARYFPDVLEVEDGAFTISLFNEYVGSQRLPCE